MPRRHKQDEDLIIRIARRLCRIAEHHDQKLGRITVPELSHAVSEATDGSIQELNPDWGPLKRVIGEGRMELHQTGPATTRWIRPPDLPRELTLLDLYDFAVSCVNPELELTCGRRGAADRDVEQITASQLTKITTAVKRLAVHWNANASSKRSRTAEENEAAWRAALAQIGYEHLVWVPEAGAKQAGDWKLLDAMAEACSEVSDSAAAAYIAGLRLLLDLARTHGYIADVALQESRIPVPDEWVEARDRWIVAVRAISRRYVPHIREVFRVVAERFHGRGIDPDRLTAAETRALHRELRRAWAAEKDLKVHVRQERIATIRALAQAGILSPDVPTTAFDQRRKRGRKSAWDDGIGNQIARSFGIDGAVKHGAGDRDCSLYRKLGSSPFFDPQNPWSLCRIIDYYTLEDRAERHSLSLEAPGLYATAGDERPTAKGDLWTTATLQKNLRTLATYVGWLERHCGVDPSESDAREIFRWEHVKALVDNVVRGGTKAWTTHRRAYDVLYLVGQISSPHLEWVAYCAGAAELQERFTELNDKLIGRGPKRVMPDGSAKYDGGATLSKTRASWAPRAGGDRAIAQAVHEAWKQVTRGDQSYAYLAMCDCRDALVEEWIDAHGVEDLGSLAHSVQVGDVELPNRGSHSFSELSDLVKLTLGLAAPARGSNINETRCSWIERTPHSIVFHVPREFMKSGKYNPDYIVPIWDSETDPPEIRELFDLYEAARLAHLERLGVAPDDVTGYFLASRPTRKALEADPVAAVELASGAANTTSSYRRAWRRGINLLGWDPQPLFSHDERGVDASHSPRHAVGIFYVRHGEIDFARHLLHHSNYKYLLKVYAKGADDRTANGVRQKLLARHKEGGE